MRINIPLAIVLVCFAFTWSIGSSADAKGVLEVVPADAIAVGVVHDIADVNKTIATLAKLVQAPAPDLLNLGKVMSGFQKGIDEHGDLAVVLTEIDLPPLPLVVVPLTNADDFFASVSATPPEAGGITEIPVQGMPTAVGTRNGFAVLTLAANRKGLEAFLAAKDTLAKDASLVAWSDANKVSAIVTSRGIKELAPKLIDQIRSTQAAFANRPDDLGKPAAQAMEMYAAIINAATTDVAQFGVGIRVNESSDTDIVARTQFAPDGALARSFAHVKPCTEDLLAGLSSGPFVFAGGAVAPQRFMSLAADFSLKMIEMQSRKPLSEEQSKKMAATFPAFMQGVRRMSMRMGPGEPGEGLYGDTEVVMQTSDAKKYLASYVKAAAVMNEVAQEIDHPFLPDTTTTRNTKVDGEDVLEVQMKMPEFPSSPAPGAPDLKAMKKAMFGPEGIVTHYLAPASPETILMVYTSTDKLKAALARIRAKKPGLAKDPGVAKVSAMLPDGAHGVAFIDLGGYVGMVRQIMTELPGGAAMVIPDLPKCLPIGIAAKGSPSGIETHLVIPADLPKAIAAAVMQFRPRPSPMQVVPDA